MIPPKLLLTSVIRPTLAHLAKAEPRMASPVAERLLLGTALAESALRAVVQTGGGPAQSVWQIEPATAEWLWGWSASAGGSIGARLRELTVMGSDDWRSQLALNPWLACGLARLRYWVDPLPLPHEDEWHRIADTWKRVYNTSRGKGTPEEFLVRAKPAMELFAAEAGAQGNSWRSAH